MDWNKKWVWPTVIISLAGIAVNTAGSMLAKALGLPLFLDTVGTILAAALGGLLPGILVGFVSNAVNSINDPISLYYGLLNMLIAGVAYLLVRFNGFKHLRSTLLCMIPFTLIGGGLGSLMTWLLYGFGFGEGISAPLAIWLYNTFGMPEFNAQLMADLAIDLLDKLVTVLIVYFVLHFLPQRWLDAVPYGFMFGRCPQPAGRRRSRILGSLRNKVVLMIIATAAVLTALASVISTLIYRDSINARYTAIGRNACSLMLNVVRGEDVDRFLVQGEQAPGYAEAEDGLRRIKDSIPEIEYMYVYKIRADGCHVVFDLDTDELQGEPAGTVVAFDSAFKSDIPALMAGEAIEPVIAKGSYGWLLTVYEPILDSDGACRAYAATDIDMADVLADRYIFAIRIISLMFGASIIIIAVSVLFAQKRLVEPIDSLALAAEHFAFDSPQSRKQNIRDITALDIRTGDEIENLYIAIIKTISDMDGYIDQVAESAAIISRMQDNIIVSFAEMVENRDENTGCHIKRTAAYVKAIGSELLREGRCPNELSAETLANFVKSAPLHDIGKIKIPDQILNKPGRLTEEEFAVIKTHPSEGKKILLSALKGIESRGYLADAMDMAACHHERWDGRGYPEGLSGNEIPLCARIMAVADVFDALMAKRSYKKAFTFEESAEIIREESGTHFDPQVAEAFFNILPEIRELSESITG